MLEKLKISNFKAWRALDMQFAKVTGLFGTNSSGKSSVLQFLLMLKQTKTAADRSLVLDFGGPDELVNLGSFNDIIHGHKENRWLDWEIDWTLSKDLVIRNPESHSKNILFQDRKLHTECRVGFRHATHRAEFLRYRFANTTFSMEPKLATRYKRYDLISDSDEFRFIRTRGRPWLLPGPVKTHLFPDQAKTFYQNSGFLREFEFAYEQLVDGMYYLGPLREYPRREYRWAGSRPSDVGTRGERTIDAILSATANEERRNLGPRMRYKSFQGMILYWLKKLGLVHSFEIGEIAKRHNLYNTQVKKNRKSPEVTLTDVGFGVSQVLPAIVLLYYVPEGSIVLMEQPEIHLHPSVQSGLADVILTVARTRNVQVIVESHSEHLLRRLQRRVAEGEMSATDVKLYFTSMDRRAAHMSDLELNEWGEVRNWPENFFGDELGEISSIQIASLERRLNGGG